MRRGKEPEAEGFFDRLGCCYGGFLFDGIEEQNGFLMVVEVSGGG